MNKPFHFKEAFVCISIEEGGIERCCVVLDEKGAEMPLIAFQRESVPHLAKYAEIMAKDNPEVEFKIMKLTVDEPVMHYNYKGPMH